MRIIISVKVNPPHTKITAVKDYSGKDKVSERNLGDSLYEILQETFQGLQSESDGRMVGDFKKTSDVKHFLVNAGERYTFDVAKDAIISAIQCINGNTDKTETLAQLERALKIVSL